MKTPRRPGRNGGFEVVTVIFNYRGLFMTAGAFGLAWAIDKPFGTSPEGPLMMIAGPILAAFDLEYRLKAKNGHLFIPSRGGSLLFLPAWCFGVVWLIFGIVYTLHPAARPV